MSTLLLTRSEINELVAMPEVIETVEKTFKGMGEGDVINPPKVHLDLGDGNSGLPYRAGMNAMPAYVGWQNVAGIKWIGGWFDNPSKGLLKLPFFNPAGYQIFFNYLLTILSWTSFIITYIIKEKV